MEKMINVTQPFLPKREEYDKIIEGVWDRNWLTNNGPVVRELEEAIASYLDIERCMYLTNGTIALQIAIKALDLKGTIITTPFSYVATTASIVWENCKVKFADINIETFNMDPDKLEAAIDEDTVAIMATHVFGNACDIAAIEEIAKKHNIAVIYDAAHCFGVKYKGQSIYSYGDVSTASFHATKLFHTIEGGAIFASDPVVWDRCHYMRNFGHNGPYDFHGLGVNGKNSEFHAAMGLANINYVDKIIKDRKRAYDRYVELLSGTMLKFQKIEENCDYNYSYMPVLFPNENRLAVTVEMLSENRISGRRYFYPALDTLPYVSKDDVLPVAKTISTSILCLPLYYGITDEDIQSVCSVVLKALEK